MTFKRILGVLAFTGSSLTVLAPVIAWMPSAVYAADAVRPQVGKPLQEAQALLKEKKYREALQKVEEAEKVGSLTDYENYVIAEFRGQAAAGAGDMPTAVKAYESVIASSRTPQATQLQLSGALVTEFYQEKNYPKAEEWVAKYKQLGGNDPKITNLLAQSYYLAGDYGRAMTEYQNIIKNQEAAGQTPPEDDIKLLGSSAQKANNTDGYIAALEMLITHYPKPAYWSDLIARVNAKPSFADRLQLDLYRVRLATNTMGPAGDYMDMAQLSLQAGFPGEAKTVLAKGYQSGKLGTGAPSDVDRQKRLKDLIDKQSDTDQKGLLSGEKDATASPSGDGLVNTGFDYVSYGQIPKGLALMEQGIAKGALKHADDAQLHLAEAYLAAGQKQKAQDALKNVKGADGTADLAHLWSLVIKSGAV